jgi:hypothetical protein
LKGSQAELRKGIKSSFCTQRLYRTRWFWTVRNAVKDRSEIPQNYTIMDDRGQLDGADQVLIPWPNDCLKPKVGLVKDRTNPPYWTKYERFLRNNEFPFEYYDIHRSDWLPASKQFDVIIWAAEGVAPEIEEHKRKTFTLERHSGKVCFPSFETLMWNEDKIYQYDWLRMHNFPVVETFISHSYSETKERIRQSVFPLVTKVHVGAGSWSRTDQDSRQAEIVGQAFSGGEDHSLQKGMCIFKFQPREYDV